MEQHEVELDGATVNVDVALDVETKVNVYVGCDRCDRHTHLEGWTAHNQFPKNIVERDIQLGLQGAVSLSDIGWARVGDRLLCDECRQNNGSDIRISESVRMVGGDIVEDAGWLMAALIEDGLSGQYFIGVGREDDLVVVYKPTSTLADHLVETTIEPGGLIAISYDSGLLMVDEDALKEELFGDLRERAHTHPQLSFKKQATVTDQGLLNTAEAARWFE